MRVTNKNKFWFIVPCIIVACFAYGVLAGIVGYWSVNIMEFLTTISPCYGSLMSVIIFFHFKNKADNNE